MKKLTAEETFSHELGFSAIKNNESITLTKFDIYRAMEKYADQFRASHPQSPAPGEVVNEKCPECDGVGKVIDGYEPYQAKIPVFTKCEKCHGSGVVAPIPSAPEAGVDKSKLLLLFSGWLSENEIHFVDGEFYAAADTDGDQPINEQKLFEMFLASLPPKIETGAPTNDELEDALHAILNTGADMVRYGISEAVEEWNLPASTPKGAKMAIIKQAESWNSIQRDRAIRLKSAYDVLSKHIRHPAPPSNGESDAVGFANPECPGGCNSNADGFCPNCGKMMP